MVFGKKVGNWSKRLLLLLSAFILSLILLITAQEAFAAGSASVLVTATGAYMAITLSASSYDFGTLTGGATASTKQGNFSVNSTSSITIDVLVQAATWTSGGTAWTYGASAYNTAQLYCSNDSATFSTTISTGSTSNLTDGLAASSGEEFELRIIAPTDFADSNQNTCNLTFTAYRQ